MCRIFGIAYGGVDECIGAAKIGRILFRELTHGGPHAWGYMRYDGENVWWHRQPGRADTKESLQQFSNQVGGNPTTWLCGHVRYATFGNPQNNKNNHPLSHGNIMGVHNGTLVNHDDILKVTGRDDVETEVDSEAIFAAVNKWGHAPGLRKIVGDMVTVYIDIRRPHVLHIGRSYGRSLSLGWTENGNLLWATEKRALLRLEGFGLKFIKFSAVREMRHITIRDGRIVGRATYGTVPAHHSEEMPVCQPTGSWARTREPIFGGPIDLDEMIAMRGSKDLALDELHYTDGTYGQKVDEDTYYYHGILMTADQYIDTLAEEMEWEWG